MSSMRSNSAEDLIEFAKEFVHLGWAVQAQLADLVAGRTEDLNRDAVLMMRDSSIYGVNAEIDNAIDDFLEQEEDEDEEEDEEDEDSDDEEDEDDDAKND